MVETISFLYRTLLKFSMSDSNPGSGFFSMGLKTHSVPMEMFAENRRRLCQRRRGAEGVTEGAVILLQGGGDQVT